MQKICPLTSDLQQLLFDSSLGRGSNSTSKLYQVDLGGGGGDIWGLVSIVLEAELSGSFKCEINVH